MMGILGVILLVVGVVLFLAPQVMMPLWPWKLTPLTAQSIGSWLITIGAVAAVVIMHEDYARPDVAGFASGAIGALQLIALARFAGRVDWNQAGAWVYLLFLVCIFLTGTYIWYRTRPGAPALGSPASTK
ncbi:MAG TPA: hypothetical protein VF478_13135 [Anaerolineae bacterium]